MRMDMHPSCFCKTTKNRKTGKNRHCMSAKRERKSKPTKAQIGGVRRQTCAGIMALSAWVHAASRIERAKIHEWKQCDCEVTRGDETTSWQGSQATVRRLSHSMDTCTMRQQRLGKCDRRDYEGERQGCGSRSCDKKQRRERECSPPPSIWTAVACVATRPCDCFIGKRQCERMSPVS